MSSRSTPAETHTAGTPDQRGARHRSAKPSRPRDLRGLWRTALALIAPLPGLLMAAEILISPFGLREDFAAVLTGCIWRSSARAVGTMAGFGIFTHRATCRTGRRLGLSPEIALVRSGWGSAQCDRLQRRFRRSLTPAPRRWWLPSKASALQKVAVINDVVSAAPVVSVASMIFLVASSDRADAARCSRSGDARTGPRWFAALLGLSGAAHLLPAWNRSRGRSLGCHWDRHHRRFDRPPSVGERRLRPGTRRTATRVPHCRHIWT